MALKDLSTTAASNTATPPNGAPEGTFLLGDISDTFRQTLAVIRTLAAADTIAAAATTDLGSKDNTFLTLTGTATTISALGTVSAGIYKFVIYNAAHTLTHNGTSLILMGGANRTVAAGDVSLFISEGSGNWRELFFADATGYQPLNTQLTNIAALDVTDGNIIVGNGTTWVAESGATARTSLGLSIGTDVQAYDVDTLKADTADVLTAGFAGTVYDAGTKSSGTFTLDEANGNLQKCVNGGAFTLAPSTNSTSIVLQVTNNASAGAVTTSGWTKVTGSFTTTNGDDFLCYCTKVGTFSHLHIQALQ